MGHELICAWLDLPADKWPPDHYALLGLAPGEADPATIEQHVHDRLEQVRCFQLAHPEPATEAMNRLAQAFICLTDVPSKKAYDATLLGEAPNAPSLRARSASKAGAATPLLAVRAGEDAAQLDWKSAPPPPRSATADSTGTTVPEVSAAADTPTLRDTVVVAAPSSVPSFTPPGQRGLTTRRALYDHLILTRRLLATWRHLGRYLSKQERPLSRPAEATDLIQQMQKLRGLVRTLPPVVGRAGQPGYLVVALARQPLIVPTVQTLLPSQREALARDWQAGLNQVALYLEYLREEVRSHRRRGRVARAARAAVLALWEHPGFVLCVLALVALNLLPAWRGYWFEQLLGLLGLAAFQFVVWWDSRQTTQKVRDRSVPPLRAVPRTPRPTP